jgi:hypothetical protein
MLVYDFSLAPVSVVHYDSADERLLVWAEGEV